MKTEVSAGTSQLDWEGIRAVVSDYGGVLTFPPTEEDWQAMAATMRVPLPCLLEGYWKHRLPYEIARYNSAKYWRLIAQGCGAELTDAAVTELVRLDNEQWGRANPDAIEVMRQLHAASFRTAILSNIQPDMLHFVEGTHRWINDFDVRVYSCKVGVAKPAAEIFLHSARLLGIPPEDCLFLDDRQDNVEGAQQAGMQALCVDSPESLIMVRAGLSRAASVTRG
jgi:putative hydrolase of the HAD superfamily